MKFIVLFLVFAVILSAFPKVVFPEEMGLQEEAFGLLIEKYKKKSIFVEKDKITKDLISEFNLKPEDLAFIFSIRGARLSFDGFDFFQNVPDLMKLGSLYKEAIEKWGSPMFEVKKIIVKNDSNEEKEIETDFYGFFPYFVSERTSIGEVAEGKRSGFYKDFYQMDYARKRFVLPK